MPDTTKRGQRKKPRRKGNSRLAKLMAEKREFRCPPDVFDTLVEHHQDVLMNIETAILLAWRSDASIDDREVKKALMACFRAETREEGGAGRVQEMLTDAREERVDVSSELWRNGLLVVLDSVGNHSSTSPGARGYLHFIDNFVV